MAKKNKKRRFQKQIEAPLNASCPFCKSKIDPDYKDFDNLAKFLNDRAKIYGKDRSGVCSKHQRRLTVAVKRARHLALLPFVPSLG
jgi:small subunit ribosomal protein S18